MATKLDQTLGKYPPAVRDLALAARRFILDSLPDAVEVIDDSDGVLGYGYGSGYSDLICTLILSKTGVKLGIVRGANLPDPDGLLEGAGKVHRYVQLREPSDLRKAGLAKLITSTEQAWRRRAASSRTTGKRRD